MYVHVIAILTGKNLSIMFYGYYYITCILNDLISWFLTDLVV